MSSLPPAVMAQLDQVLAQSEPVVEEFVQIARETISTQGPVAAVGILATILERANQPAKLSTVAAIALVRLALLPDTVVNS